MNSELINSQFVLKIQEIIWYFNHQIEFFKLLNRFKISIENQSRKIPKQQSANLTDTDITDDDDPFDKKRPQNHDDSSPDILLNNNP